MNYELAKELKEAGFPQRSDYGYRGASILSYHRTTPVETDVRIPTLEELTSELGDNFGKLEKIEQGWIASSKTHVGFHIAYSTPLIAVARLWLALNKKV